MTRPRYLLTQSSLAAIPPSSQGGLAPGVPPRRMVPQAGAQFLAAPRRRQGRAGRVPRDAGPYDEHGRRRLSALCIDGMSLVTGYSEMLAR
jgi:hypothetical protein